MADPFGASEAFETSLAIARERKECFEVALTLNALIELDRLEGVEPPQEVVDESRAAIANLKIRALPRLPDRLNPQRETKSGHEGRSSLSQVQARQVARMIGGSRGGSMIRLVTLMHAGVSTTFGSLYGPHEPDGRVVHSSLAMHAG